MSTYYSNASVPYYSRKKYTQPKKGMGWVSDVVDTIFKCLGNSTEYKFRKGGYHNCATFDFLFNSSNDERNRAEIERVFLQRYNSYIQTYWEQDENVVKNMDALKLQIRFLREKPDNYTQEKWEKECQKRCTAYERRGYSDGISKVKYSKEEMTEKFKKELEQLKQGNMFVFVVRLLENGQDDDSSYYSD